MNKATLVTFCTLLAIAGCDGEGPATDDDGGAPSADAGGPNDGGGGGPDGGGEDLDAGPEGGLPALGELMSEVITMETFRGQSEIRLGSDGQPRAMVAGSLWIRDSSGVWSMAEAPMLGAGSPLRLGADDTAFSARTGLDPAFGAYDGTAWTFTSVGLPADSVSANGPDLALAPGDLPVIAWRDAMNEEAHVSIWDGSAFTDEVIESAPTMDADVAVDAQVEVDADGALHVVYNVESEGTIELHYATNGSGSWLIEPIPVVTQPALALDSMGDPRVVGTREADVYYVRRVGGAWTETMIETSPRLRTLDIEVDQEDRAHIVYTIVAMQQLTYRRETAPNEFDRHTLVQSSTIPEVGLALDGDALPHIVASFTAGLDGGEARYLHY